MTLRRTTVLVGDGRLDASRPEILIDEQRGSRLRLLGVEFLTWSRDVDSMPPVFSKG